MQQNHAHSSAAVEAVAANGPTVRHAAASFIFVTALLDTLSFGVALPALPELIRQLVGGDFARAAWWFGVYAAIFAAAQFLFSPALGALSDRFGRRPVVLISNFGMAVNYATLAIAPSLWLLLAARLLLGITASSLATANAYIADTTPPEKRVKAFSIVGSAFGLGFIVGPALGGFLGSFSVRMPFWISAGLALLNSLYGFFVLPESLSKERRATRFELKDANPVGALVMLKTYPSLLDLGISSFLMDLAACALRTMFVLYAGYRYGWNTQAIGLFLMIMAFMTVFVQIGLAGRLASRFGDRKVMLAGLLFGIASYVCMGLASTGREFVIAALLLALNSLADPTIQAIMSRKVKESEQGRLQSAIRSLDGLAGIFGPYLFAQVFALSINKNTSSYFAGATFIVAAMCELTGVVVAVRATRKPSISAACLDEVNLA